MSDTNTIRSDTPVSEDSFQATPVELSHNRLLQEQEQMFRETFEQAAVGIAHVGVDGSWLRVNQRLCNIVGYEHDDLLRRTFQDLTHPDDLHTDLEWARKVLGGVVPSYSMEKRYIRRNGSVVWINLTVSLVRDETTGDPQYFISVIEDIDARKRAEAALRESEDRLRFLTEMTREGVLIHDNGIILDANDAFARLFSFKDASEILGRSLTDFHPEAEMQVVARHIRDGWEGAYEITGVKADGSSFPMEVTVRRSVYQGRPVRVASLRDLTERERIRRAEAERTAVLEENARLRRNQAETISFQKRFLRDVLYSVTEGKLHLCDSPANLPAPLPQVVEPVFVVPAALSRIRRSTEDTALDHGLPFERVFDLVTAVGECAMNAHQHSGDTAQVWVGAERGKVQVWVQDRGKGIDVSDLPKAALLKGHSGGDSFGHGFHMMLQTVDAIWLLTGPLGTTVVLEQAAVAPEPFWLRLASV